MLFVVDMLVSPACCWYAYKKQYLLKTGSRKQPLGDAPRQTYTTVSTTCAKSGISMATTIHSNYSRAHSLSHVPKPPLKWRQHCQATVSYTGSDHTTDVRERDDMRRVLPSNRLSSFCRPAAPCSVISCSSFSVSSLMFTRCTSVKGVVSIF